MNYINNYYTLLRAVAVIKQKAIGATLLECCSLNKQELVFVFNEGIECFSIKVWLGDDSFIYLVEEDIKLPNIRQLPFNDLTELKLADAFVHSQDRSFRLVFDNGLSIVIALYGRNGNVFLFDSQGGIVKAFRQGFKRDEGRKLQDFDIIKPSSEAEFTQIANEFSIIKAIEINFAAVTKEMIEKSAVDLSNPDIAYKNLNALQFSFLGNTLYIIDKQGENQIKPQINLDYYKAPEDKCLFESNDIVATLKEFAKAYFKSLNAIKWRTLVLKELDNKIKKARKAIDSGLVHIDKLDKEKNYRHLADLIMANLHDIPKGSEIVTLQDFYQDKEIEIKLNPRINPQNWAEKLYRKAKNQEIEYQMAFEKLEENEKLVKELEAEYKQVQETDDIKGLKQRTKISEELATATEASPFRHITFEGYDIYIGKSATVNDKLTFGFANKEDLWMHARGVSGSHIIVKHKKKGEVFPAQVIERAAEIAAFYSKGKTSGMVPVAYTLKKYVRKPKGAAPGAVIMEKEEVIIVEPKPYLNVNL